MEEYPRFFSMASEEEEWKRNRKVAEDTKLELRLGPPGEISLGCKTNLTTQGAKRAIQHTAVAVNTAEGNWFTDVNEKQCKKFSCYEEADEKILSSSWLSGSLHSSTFHRDSQEEFQKPKPSFPQCPDEMAGSSTLVSASFPATIAGPGTNSGHQRAALAPVVGWPPVRSFRKNLASGSKLVSELPNRFPKGGSSLKPEGLSNDLFVKINMEGVPIGRKINLNAYGSYESLSVAVDELFRDLLAAQRETSGKNETKMDEARENADSVNGSGEYTLVYEDSEGDRILVGDVPWNMFVSTAKRLRVLKSAEISTSRHSIGINKQEKTPLSSAVENGR